MFEFENFTAIHFLCTMVGVYGLCRAIPSLFKLFPELSRGKVNEPLCVKILGEGGRVPEQGTPHSAGYDLFSPVEMTIAPGSRALVGLEIAICPPRGTYGRIAPRSGLAYMNSIDVSAGVIDRDYSRAVGVLLVNHGKDVYRIQKGDRVAQLVLEKIAETTIRVVKVLPNEEGFDHQGFGSTGR